MPSTASARSATCASGARAGGASFDKQVARELGLSVSSVRTYLGPLFEKTSASRRAGLAQWATRLR